MTARELQTAIMDDLNDLFKNRLFKTPDRTMAPPRSYRQALPKRSAQDEEDPFPYIIVRLDHGGVETKTDPHKVAVLLLVGVFDDALGETVAAPPPEDSEWDTRNYGYDAVCEIVELIQKHYEQTPSLHNGDFYFDGPFHWVVQDEDSYPYYFGACEMEFTLIAPREDVSQFT